MSKERIIIGHNGKKPIFLEQNIKDQYLEQIRKIKNVKKELEKIYKGLTEIEDALYILGRED